MPALKKNGLLDIKLYDFALDRGFAVQAEEDRIRMGLPRNLVAHLSVYIGRRISFQDHIPRPLLEDTLSRWDQLPERLVLYTSNMHGEGDRYAAWDFRGQLRVYPMATPINRFLEEIGMGPQGGQSSGEDSQGGPQPGGGLPATTAPPDGAASGAPADGALPGVPARNSAAQSQAQEAVSGEPARVEEEGLPLSMVLAAGLLDGVNPCAIAVLLFLVAFLFAVRRSARSVRTLAALFVGTVLVVYFLLGLGLFGTATAVLSQSHLVSRIAAIATIGVGLWGFFAWGASQEGQRRGPGLSERQWTGIKQRLQRGTVPGTIAGAALVAVCTVPCSGYVYVSVLALLASQASRAQGLGYLAAYNLAYILPLAMLAVAAVNPLTARALAQLERRHQRALHMASSAAITMVGVALWFWLA